jgi:hypothetical protein
MICFCFSSHQLAKISSRSTYSILLLTAHEDLFNLSRSTLWMKVCIITLYRWVQPCYFTRAWHLMDEKVYRTFSSGILILPDPSIYFCFPCVFVISQLAHFRLVYLCSFFFLGGYLLAKLLFDALTSFSVHLCRISSIYTLLSPLCIFFLIF